LIDVSTDFVEDDNFKEDLGDKNALGWNAWTPEPSEDRRNRKVFMLLLNRYNRVLEDTVLRRFFKCEQTEARCSLSWIHGTPKRASDEVSTVGGNSTLVAASWSSFLK
jgi:hypothetical protein